MGGRSLHEVPSSMIASNHANALIDPADRTLAEAVRIERREKDSTGPTQREGE